MQVRKIQPEEQSVVEAFLQEQLETSLYLLNNVIRGGLEFHGEPYQAEYFGVFREDHALIGLAAHTWLNTLLVQAPAREALTSLQSTLPRFLTRPVLGVLGPRDQCLELMDRMGLDVADAVLDQDEPVYSIELTRMRRPSLLDSPSVRVRTSRETDLKLLTQWRVEYLMEVMHFALAAKLERRAAAEVLRAHQGRNAFVLEVGREPAAYCSFGATIPRAVQLSGIWTPRAFRHRGYGTSVTAGALEHARFVEGHRKAVLFIDDGNRPALAGCESLGFQRVGRYSFTLWE